MITKILNWFCPKQVDNCPSRTRRDQARRNIEIGKIAFAALSTHPQKAQIAKDADAEWRKLLAAERCLIMTEQEKHDVDTIALEGAIEVAWMNNHK